MNKRSLYNVILRLSNKIILTRRQSWYIVFLFFWEILIKWNNEACVIYHDLSLKNASRRHERWQNSSNFRHKLFNFHQWKSHIFFRSIDKIWNNHTNAGAYMKYLWTGDLSKWDLENNFFFLEKKRSENKIKNEPRCFSSIEIRK